MHTSVVWKKVIRSCHVLIAALVALECMCVCRHKYNQSRCLRCLQTLAAMRMHTMVLLSKHKLTRHISYFWQATPLRPCTMENKLSERQASKTGS